MTHTLGPWATRLYATDDNPDELRKHGIEPVRMLANDGGMSITAGDRRVAVADLMRTDVKRGEAYKAEDDERDANARLIAAAPDLLAALEAIIAAHDGGIGGTYIRPDMRNRIRAAIAKARQS